MPDFEAEIDLYEFDVDIEGDEFDVDVEAQGPPGPKGDKGDKGDPGTGTFIAEFLSMTSARIWNLSQTPVSSVAVFDSVPMKPGYDYTIAGRVVTFAFIDPVDPFAMYQA